jgi:polyadenylation factor subunit 2
MSSTSASLSRPLVEVGSKRLRPRRAVAPATAFIVGDAVRESAPGASYPGMSALSGAPIAQPSSAWARAMLPAALCASPVDGLLTRWVVNCINKVKSPVLKVAFWADGSRFLTASANEFTEWQGSTHNFVGAFPTHAYSITAMRFNHAGSYIVSGDEGGCIKYLTSALSPEHEMRADGAAAAAGAGAGAEAPAGVLGLAFAPGDRKFAASSADGAVRVWDFFGRRVDAALRAHSGEVRALAWHGAHALIASGGKDATVRLWDAAAARELRALSCHTTAVSAVAFCPHNAHWLLSGSRDNTVRLHDLRALRAPLESWAVERKGVTALAWHPAAERLFCAGSYDGSLAWFSPGKPYALAEVPHAHDGAIWDFAFEPGATAMVTASNDQTAKVWVRPRPGDTAQQYAYQGHALRGYADNLNVLALPGAVLPGVPAVQAPFVPPEPREEDAGEDDAGGGGGGGGARAGGGAAAAQHAHASSTQQPFAPGTRRPPPASYVCHICKVHGHWREECPSAPQLGPAGTRVRGPPPPNYICRKCQQPGHWIEECPTTAGKGGGAGGGGGGGPRGGGGGGASGSGGAAGGSGGSQAAAAAAAGGRQAPMLAAAPVVYSELELQMMAEMARSAPAPRGQPSQQPPPAPPLQHTFAQQQHPQHQQPPPYQQQLHQNPHGGHHQQQGRRR